MNKLIILLIAASAAFSSCTNHDVEPCPIVPIYNYVYNVEHYNASKLDSIIHTDSAAFKAYFDIVSPGVVDSAHLASWSASTPVRIFTPAVDSVYPDISILEHKLGGILKNASSQGLKFPSRKYAAVVWGNLKSIIFADDVMLIALNHYLGEDYKGYQNRLWPAYMRSEKTPVNLPYDITEALVATEFPFTDSDGTTALSRMIYEGALIETKMRLVPDADLAIALGYNDTQLDWFKHNSKELWQMAISKKLLYDTSKETAARLVDKSPSTSILSPYVPGRAGRYIGYMIVRSYIKRHPDTPLQYLLSSDFYNNDKTLPAAGYNGD